MEKKKYIRRIIIISSALIIGLLVYKNLAQKKLSNYSPAYGFFVHVDEKSCSRNMDFKGTHEQMVKLCPEGFHIIRRVRI